MRYSEKFKAKMVRRMLPPEAMSAVALSRLTKVSQPTLSRWLRDSVAVVSPTQPPPPPPRSSRPPAQWPLRERMRVVLAAESLADDALGGFLRAEGITSEDLAAWRKLGEATDAAEKLSGGARKRIRELERELKRKDKALAEGAAMLFLEKKLKSLVASGAFSGAEDDDTDAASEP